MLCCSISPGNVMTPLWEELAGQTPDAAAAIKAGENAQVSFNYREHGSRTTEKMEDVISTSQP